MTSRLPIANELILTAGPYINELEIEYGLDAIKNGWNKHHSDYLVRFERKVAEFCGAKFAMATSSCTGAMHLTLIAMGIGENDEVIVPELTWIATASAVCYVKAKPIFCDVDPITWTMDPKSVEKLITAKTKAIMPVHLYGHPCDMDPLYELAKKHNLKIIEDAAQSMGSEYKGKRTGGLGDAGCFSFQGAKAIVTGEGGMFLTNDEDIYNKVRFWGDHGRHATKPLYNIAVGYKYKMSNVQAAIGCAQMEKADEIVAKKRQIFSWYKERLSDVEELQLNGEESWAKNIFWMSSVILSDKINMTRDDFIAELKSRMIDSRPIFYPISSFDMFETQNNPNAYHVGLRGINLPSGHFRTEEEIDYICGHIRQMLGRDIGKCNVLLSGDFLLKQNVEHEIKQSKQKSIEIPILSNGNKVGSLVSVTSESLSSIEDIKLFAKWRENAQQYFPSQREITMEGTRSWLEKALLSVSDRMLFWVLDENSDKIGHIGLFRFDYRKSSCELDNVIRGEKAWHELMKCASLALIKYTKDVLKMKDIFLRCFSDNQKAIALYEKIDFKEINRVPLEKRDGNGITSWVECHDRYKQIERYFVTMQHGVNCF